MEPLNRNTIEKIRIYLVFLFVISIFVSLPVTQIAAILLFLVSVLEYRREIYRKIPPLGILFFGMLISGLAGVIFSPAPAISAPALMRFVIPLGIFGIWQTMRDDKIRQWLVKAIVLAGSAAALLGIVNFLKGLPRTQGFFGGYFTLATQMALSLPITVNWLQRQKGKWRAAANVALFVQLLALWWTFTRSAFLGVMLGCALVGLLEFVRGKGGFAAKLRGVQLWWGVPLLIMLLIITSPDPRINPLAQDAKPATKTTQSGDFTSGRSSIIQDAVQILKDDLRKNQWDNILLGHGLRSRILLVESQFKSWESDFLEAMMNQGLIGLLLTLAIYLVVAQQLIKRWRRQSVTGELAGLTAALLAFMLMAMLTLQLQSLNAAAVFAFLAAWVYSPREGEN